VPDLGNGRRDILQPSRKYARDCITGRVAGPIIVKSQYRKAHLTQTHRELSKSTVAVDVLVAHRLTNNDCRVPAVCGSGLMITAEKRLVGTPEIHGGGDSGRSH
jgi:hypothetical protein